MEYGRSNSNLNLCTSSSDPTSELTLELSREVTGDAELYVGEGNEILVEDGRSIADRIGVAIPEDAGCRIGVAVPEDAGCRIGVAIPEDAIGVGIPEDAGCRIGVGIPEDAECREGECNADCPRGDVGSSSQDGTVRLKQCSEP